jgi:hypothetical protein
MIRKEVKINNGLKEWLGENPTWGDIGFIFGGAFLATGLLIDGYSDELRQLPLWRSILFVVVAFDIIGGAIANFSVSTDRYYSQNRKKRWLFFAEHMVHFLLLYLAIGGNIRFWVFIFAYTMVGGIIVDQIRERRIQEMAAPVFVTVGCLLFYGFDLLIPFMEWFPAVFMIKIILGFSVRRAKPTGNLLITTKNKK